MTAQSKITSSRLQEVTASAGSEIVKALEQVWDLIRANHPELPEVVIVTGSGMIGPP